MSSCEQAPSMGQPANYHPITLSAGLDQPGLQSTSAAVQAGPLARIAPNLPFDQLPPQPIQGGVEMSPFPSTTSLRGGGGADAFLGPPGPRVSDISQASYRSQLPVEATISQASYPSKPSPAQLPPAEETDVDTKENASGSRHVKSEGRHPPTLKPPIRPSSELEAAVSPLSVRSLTGTKAITKDQRPDPRNSNMQQAGPHVLFKAAAALASTTPAKSPEHAQAMVDLSPMTKGNFSPMFDLKLDENKTQKEASMEEWIRSCQSVEFPGKTARSPPSMVPAVPLWQQDRQELQRALELQSSLEQQKALELQRALEQAHQEQANGWPPKDASKGMRGEAAARQKPRTEEEGSKGGRQVKFQDQSIPNLVALLTSKNSDEVASATAELEKVCKTEDGREAVLAVPQSSALIAAILGKDNVVCARHAVKTLASLSMDARGRDAITSVGNDLDDLARILRGQDKPSVQ